MSTKTDLLISIDCETLAVGPDAVVTQIAFKAVDKMDPDDTIGFVEYYLPIQPQIDAGRLISADTLKYWILSGEEARNKLLESIDGDVNVLTAFVRSFIRKLTQCIEDSKASGGDYEIWIRGVSFDVPIFESLAHMCGEFMPWERVNDPKGYRKLHELRTLMELAGVTTQDVDNTGIVAHVALEDCRYQIMCHTAAIKKLGS